MSFVEETWTSTSDEQNKFLITYLLGLPPSCSPLDAAAAAGALAEAAPALAGPDPPLLPRAHAP